MCLDACCKPFHILSCVSNALEAKQYEVDLKRVADISLLCTFKLSLHWQEMLSSGKLLVQLFSYRCHPITDISFFLIIQTFAFRCTSGPECEGLTHSSRGWRVVRRTGRHTWLPHSTAFRLSAVKPSASAFEALINKPIRDVGISEKVKDTEMSANSNSVILQFTLGGKLGCCSELSYLLCLMCEMPLIEPRQCSCGDRICSGCYKSSLARLGKRRFVKLIEQLCKHCIYIFDCVNSSQTSFKCQWCKLEITTDEVRAPRACSDACNVVNGFNCYSFYVLVL